jgi:hypothetical protein
MDEVRFKRPACKQRAPKQEPRQRPRKVLAASDSCEFVLVTREAGPNQPMIAFPSASGMWKEMEDPVHAPRV